MYPKQVRWKYWEWEYWEGEEEEEYWEWEWEEEEEDQDGIYIRSRFTALDEIDFTWVRTFKSHRGATFFEADCGDFTLITPFNTLLIKNPRLLVAIKDTGIPNELKIKDGKLFSIKCPRLDDLPTHSLERLNLLLVQGFHKAHDQLIRMSKEEKDGQELLDFEEFEDHSITLDVTTVEGSDDPLPSTLLEKMEIAKDVWYTYESPRGFTILVRDLGDFFYHTYLEGILVNKPGVIVAAVGGIPDELKINGGISFSLPAPVIKLPKQLPKDPIERERVNREVVKRNVATESLRKAIAQAFLKAVGVSSNCEQLVEDDREEARYTDELFPTVLEFNLASPQALKQLDSVWSMVSHSIPNEQVKAISTGGGGGGVGRPTIPFNSWTSRV